MNIEDLAQQFKHVKIGDPKSCLPVYQLPESVLTDFTEKVQSVYDLTDDKYSTKEQVFYDTRRIVAKSKYNKETTQFYSTMDFDDELTVLAKPIAEEINKFLPDYVPALCQLATILPGQQLKWHIDVFLYQQFTNKLHIPISTNEDSFFDVFVDDDCVDRVNMKVGSIYNINNLALHRSINKGTTPRTHLIIDVIKKDTVEKLLDMGINFFHTRLPSMSEKEKISLDNLVKKYG
jgi:hypothetical protein